MPHPIRRSETDACPGALRLHQAADGPLARIRLPGGRLTGAQLAVLASLATEAGDGGMELTSRANVQLRALNRTTPTELAARLSAAGLLPSPTHETVRNIAAPPLADARTRALIHDLDFALCADPALAALPGRFLFAIGTVPLAPDVSAVPDGDAFAILFAGHDEGLRVPANRVVTALLAAAHAFLSTRARLTATHRPAADLGELPSAPNTNSPRSANGTAGPDSAQARFADLGEIASAPNTNSPRSAEGAAKPDSTQARFADLGEIASGPNTNSPRSAEGGAEPRSAAGAGALAWRLAELPGGARMIAEQTATALGVSLREVAALAPGFPTSPVGVLRQPDGRVAVGAIVPLGRLTGVQMQVLAEADQLVVTAWRGVVVADLSPEAAVGWQRRLTEAGLPAEPDSRWTGVTACAGLPGCAKSRADIRADALTATRFVDGLPVHWLGCDRGCGSPAGPHVRVEATPDGYVIRTPDGTLTKASASPAAATAAPLTAHPHPVAGGEADPTKNTAAPHPAPGGQADPTKNTAAPHPAPGGQADPTKKNAAPHPGAGGDQAGPAEDVAATHPHPAAGGDAGLAAVVAAARRS
ncbi:hypothetical protein [Actinoplanes sp. NPDC026619]|uniref:hypothetical protein n=1 Tax=Actinoplanes sp. NPDC026619 TaxID=3155798 RepID=UPI0033D6DC40